MRARNRSFHDDAHVGCRVQCLATEGRDAVDWATTPTGGRERRREPGDSFEWVAFNLQRTATGRGTLSTRERCARRASQRPRPAVATSSSGAESNAGASNAREPRPRRSAGGARTVQQWGRAAPTRSIRRTPRSCVRTSFVIGTVRPQRMATCQAAELSRQACSRSRALQESRPERPQPKETEAGRALRRNSR